MSRGLVVFQIVVTCILLIGSLLQVRSILNQQTIDYGYDTDGILSARMGLMDGDYPTPDARKLFYDRLLRQLSANPEFDAVGFTSRFRMVFAGNGPIEIDGKIYKDKKDRPLANFEQVTGSFFDVTSQKLLEGRTFNDDDLDSKLPVAIVNAAFARKHYGNESPIGRRFRTMNNAGTQPGPWRTIVGVVSTVRMLGPFNNQGVDDSGFYVPFYSTAVRSGAAGAVRQPVRDGDRQAARGPAAPTRWSTRCAARSTRRTRTCRSTSSARRSSSRGLRRAEPHHRVDVRDLRRGRGGARVGRHLRRHVVLGEPADAGVRRADGARRERRHDPRRWC